MKKITVLIADDDRLVLEDLCAMVNWNKLGFTIVEAVDSGEAAISALEKWQPDLYITDICMKGMNGLDVIEYARVNYKKMKYLVISSYDDFTYAKRAISNDVIDYILKTEITPAKLTKILLKIKESFFRKQEASVFEKNELEYFFNHPTELVHLSDLPNISYLDHLKYLFLVITPVQIFNRTPGRNERKITSDVKNIIYETVKDYCAFPILCEMSDSIVIGLSIEGSIGAARLALYNVKHALYYRLSETSAYLKFYSEDVWTLETFRTYFWKNYPFIQYYQFFHQTKSTMDFKKMERLNYIPSDQAFSFHSLLFEEEHMEQNIMQIKEYISRCNENYDICALTTFYRSFCTYIEIRSNNQLRLPDILVAPFVEQFQKWIYNQLYECIQILKRGLKYKYNPVVDAAINFMYQKYGNGELTSMDIAAHVGLSANRLGVLFKKDTGKTVNEFLNNIRVEKAIFFLEETNMKIYEISEKCGYRSSQYFSQIVLQRTGKRPIDFRKAPK